MPVTKDFSRVDYGGYLELDLPFYSDPFPGALLLQSGRAALRALLEFEHIKDVFLPEYVCGSVLSAVEACGAKANWYSLDDDLFPEGLPDNIPSSCKVLYVNYFGLLDRQVERIADVLSPTSLIIDNCQALFSKPRHDSPSVYSIRKFLGVPDGGLIWPNSLGIPIPLERDNESIFRILPRLMRLQDGAESGYKHYLLAEKSLEDTSPQAMSGLTKRLLQSNDFELIRNKRRKNFNDLHNLLGVFNCSQWILNAEMVPLCYPLILDFEVSHIKKSLLAKNIFLPSYWPELERRFKPGSVEYRLANCTLYLPIDQRYGEPEMRIMAAETVSLLEKHRIK